jgi:hypothetical protein
MRTLGTLLLAAALATAATACSNDDDEATSSDRGVITFEDPPAGSTDLGLCYAYDIAQMKELVGGEETFRRLAPEAIGTEGDAVTGEACAWERAEANGDSRTLRIEVRNYVADTASLAEQFATLEEGTLEAQPVEGLGDAAYSSTSEETSLLQVRSAGYMLTLASRATGSLDPIALDSLELLAAAGLEQLP